MNLDKLLCKAKRISDDYWAVGYVYKAGNNWFMVSLNDKTYVIAPATIKRCTGYKYVDGSHIFEDDYCKIETCNVVLQVVMDNKKGIRVVDPKSDVGLYYSNSIEELRLIQADTPCYLDGKEPESYKEHVMDIEGPGPYSWSVEIVPGVFFENHQTHNKYPSWFHRTMMRLILGWKFKKEY